MRYLYSLIFLLLTLSQAFANVVVYPAGQDVETLDDFAVRVRPIGGQWQSLAVYPVKVDRVANAKHNVEIASMAYLDADEPIEVEVVSNKGAIDVARVRPLSYNIESAIDGAALRFIVDQPRNLSVEVNGDIFHNLHLFINPIDANRPAKLGKKRSQDLIYFAPGVHQLPGDTMRIPSGTTVYVDGGARVKGRLIVDGAENVRIYGRGEIHPEGRGEGVYIKRSRNVEVDGVIVTQLPVGESDSVRVTNVKSISSYGWGDGMNVFASSNCYYDRCFCRNSDDCTTVYATRKGFNGDSRNILMERSVLWADVAHPFMIGLHGNPEDPDTIEHIAYRDIDVIDHCENQIDYQGVFAINVGDNNLVRDVLFEDIRVENFRKGQLFNIRIFYNRKYCAAPGVGVEDVTFRNITYNGDNAALSIIAGYDQERKVKNVTFDNLVINGQHIHDAMAGKPAWYKTSDFANIFIGEHTDNITFK